MEITIKTEDAVVFEKIKSFLDQLKGVKMIIPEKDTYNTKDEIDLRIEAFEAGKADLTAPLNTKEDIERYFSIPL